MAILGDVFMRNFYTVHDYTNMRQGIVPLANVDTVKVAPVAGTPPTCAYDDTSCNGFPPLISEELMFILQVMAAVIFFIVLPGVGSYFAFFRKEKTVLPDGFVPDGANSDYG